MQIYTIQTPYQNLESQIFKKKILLPHINRSVLKKVSPRLGFVLLDIFGSSSKLQKYMLDT